MHATPPLPPSVTPRASGGRSWRPTSGDLPASQVPLSCPPGLTLSIVPGHRGGIGVGTWALVAEGDRVPTCSCPTWRSHLWTGGRSSMRYSTWCHSGQGLGTGSRTSAFPMTKGKAGGGKEAVSTRGTGPTARDPPAGAIVASGLREESPRRARGEGEEREGGQVTPVVTRGPRPPRLPHPRSAPWGNRPRGAGRLWGMEGKAEGGRFGREWVSTSWSGPRRRHTH